MVGWGASCSAPPLAERRRERREVQSRLKAGAKQDQRKFCECVGVWEKQITECPCIIYKRSINIHIFKNG